jgi:copper chaperone CopZ
VERTTLEIDGMTCAHCVGAVARALGGLAGVEAERVEIGSATVRYDPERIRPEQIRSAVEEEGYTVREPGSAS